MAKIKLIAETAWHHDGDFAFMQKLVDELMITDIDATVNGMDPDFSLIKKNSYAMQNASLLWWRNKNYSGSTKNTYIRC